MNTYHRLIQVPIQVVLAPEVAKQLLHLSVVDLVGSWLVIGVHSYLILAVMGYGIINAISLIGTN